MLILDINNNDKGQLYAHKSTLSNGWVLYYMTIWKFFDLFWLFPSKKLVSERKTQHMQ